MTKDKAKEIILRHGFLFASMPDDVLEALHTLMEDETRGQHRELSREERQAIVEKYRRDNK